VVDLSITPVVNTAPRPNAKSRQPCPSPNYQVPVGTQLQHRRQANRRGEPLKSFPLSATLTARKRRAPSSRVSVIGKREVRVIADTCNDPVRAGYVYGARTLAVSPGGPCWCLCKSSMRVLEGTSHRAWSQTTSVDHERGADEQRQSRHGVSIDGTCLGGVAVAGFSLLRPTGAAFATTSTLTRGNSLSPGQALWSTSGQYEAIFQADGNFVIYASSGVARWNTGTEGLNSLSLVMQNDGNMVIYDPSGQPLWSVGNGGFPPYNEAAAGSYADAYAVNWNSNYQSYSPEDCTNFVSQALYAGLQPNYVGNGDYTNYYNWWVFPNSDPVDIYIYGRSASYSATVAQGLRYFLINTGWGSDYGSFSYTSGNPAPSSTPLSGDGLGSL